MRQLFLIAALLFSHQVMAYYTTMDTADLVPEGKYHVGAELQFVTDGDSGVNAIGRFDGRLSDESAYRAEVGFGVTDIQLAGYYKWAPIPDTRKQPGMAILGGLSFARNSSINDLSIRVMPIVSKKYRANMGDFTPYASLPVSIQSIDGNTTLPIQLTLGSQLKTRHFKNVVFMGEISFNLKDAFTYFSLGVVINADKENGLMFN